MKLKLAGIAVLVMVSCVEARAGDCEESLGGDDRQFITCTSFTESLLMSLEGATKKAVIAAMIGKTGRRSSDDGENLLHYASSADGFGGYGGDVYFEMTGDRVTRIYGSVTGSGLHGRDGQFIWYPSQNDQCSDFPGSRYRACKYKRGE